MWPSSKVNWSPSFLWFLSRQPLCFKRKKRKVACKRIQCVPLSTFVSLILADDLQIQRIHKLTFDLCSKESHLFALLSLVLREVTLVNP